MRAEDFASHYERDSFVPPDLPKDLGELMKPAGISAQAFGEYLYDYLVGDDSRDHTFSSFMTAYNALVPSLVKNTSLQINKGGWSLKEKLTAERYLNFHRLNAPMVAEWELEGIRGSKNESTKRLHAHNLTQEALAISALHDYARREKMAGLELQFAYFDSELEEVRSTIEGSLNQVDSGIVLVEAAKVDDLTILAAPPQFSRSKNSAANVDFIAIAPGKEVFGIQSRTTVRSEDIAKYDDHVVLIDARVDLENEMARRTSIKSSKLKVVSWAGIIAAQTAAALPDEAKKSYFYRESPNPRRIPLIAASRERGKQFAGDIPSVLPLATQRVLSRLHDHPLQAA